MSKPIMTCWKCNGPLSLADCAILEHDHTYIELYCPSCERYNQVFCDRGEITCEWRNGFTGKRTDVTVQNEKFPYFDAAKARAAAEWVQT